MRRDPWNLGTFHIYIVSFHSSVCRPYFQLFLCFHSVVYNLATYSSKHVNLIFIAWGWLSLVIWFQQRLLWLRHLSFSSFYYLHCYRAGTFKRGLQIIRKVCINFCKQMAPLTIFSKVLSKFPSHSQARATDSPLGGTYFEYRHLFNLSDQVENHKLLSATVTKWTWRLFSELTPHHQVTQDSIQLLREPGWLMKEKSVTTDFLWQNCHKKSLQVRTWLMSNGWKSQCLWESSGDSTCFRQCQHSTAGVFKRRRPFLGCPGKKSASRNRSIDRSIPSTLDSRRYVTECFDFSRALRDALQSTTECFLPMVTHRIQRLVPRKVCTSNIGIATPEQLSNFLFTMSSAVIFPLVVTPSLPSYRHTSALFRSLPWHTNILLGPDQSMKDFREKERTFDVWPTT